LCPVPTRRARPSAGRRWGPGGPPAAPGTGRPTAPMAKAASRPPAMAGVGTTTDQPRPRAYMAVTVAPRSTPPGRRPAGETERLGLRVSSALGRAPVAGDRALLERLVANLVDNAVRHNHPGDWVEVDTGRARPPWPSSGSPTAVPRSPSTRSPPCSTPSAASTPTAPAPTVAPASASPSSARSPPPTAATPEHGPWRTEGWR